MILQWKGNSGPIVASNGGKLQTSHGPGLIAAVTLLQMIYVGKSTEDDNLWSASTLAASFPQWDSNQKIDGSMTQPGNSVPRSSYRPALALFNNMIHMVYVGTGGENLWWAWCKPNGQWTNVKLPWSGANTPAPALAVHSDGKLYLAWHEYSAAVPNVSPEHNYIKFSSLASTEPLDVSSWAAPQVVGDGATKPTMGSFRNTLYIFATPLDSTIFQPTQILMSTLNRGTWSSFAPFEITGSNPLSSGGGAVVVFSNELYLIYPGAGGNNLWYAWIDAQGQSHGNVQIKISGSNIPKTSAPIGVTSFGRSLCVAYKGENSNNVWSCYGTP